MNSIAEGTLGRRMFNASGYMPFIVLACYIVFNTILVRLALWLTVVALTLELYDAVRAACDTSQHLLNAQNDVERIKKTDSVLLEVSKDYRHSATRMETLLDAHVAESEARVTRNKAFLNLGLNLAYMAILIAVMQVGFGFVLLWCALTLLPEIFQFMGKYAHNAKQKFISLKESMLGKDNWDHFVKQFTPTDDAKQEASRDGLTTDTSAPGEQASSADKEPMCGTHVSGVTEETKGSLQHDRADYPDLHESREKQKLSTRIWDLDLPNIGQVSLALSS